MNKRSQFFLLLGVLVVMLIALAVPQIRNWVWHSGTSLGYAGLFLVSLLGGISLVIPLPYPILIVALASSGYNPWLLALVAATGATAGDGVSYLLGYTGAEAYSKHFERFRTWAKRVYDNRPWSAPFLMLLWASFSPFPNELFVIPFGLANYGAKKTLAISGTGNFIFSSLIAHGFMLFV